MMKGLKMVWGAFPTQKAGTPPHLFEGQHTVKFCTCEAGKNLAAKEKLEKLLIGE
jgi:hypothetical protein